MKNRIKFCQGHIYYADFRINVLGSEQLDKKRLLSESINVLSLEDYRLLQIATAKSLGLMNLERDAKNVRRGDIFLANLGKGIGCEFKGLVPIVVIQNNLGNKHSPTVIIIPINLNLKEERLPTHVLITEDQKSITNIRQSGKILGEQIRTIDRMRLVSKIGRLSHQKMKEVDLAITNSLSIDTELLNQLGDL